MIGQLVGNSHSFAGVCLTWASFPHFVLSGGWYRALRPAT